MHQNKLLNKANFKIWSRLGMRATFGVASLELANSVDKLMILTGDVSTSAGLDRFRKKFTDKYIDVGIAEQNLIGIGAGLASEGFNVIKYLPYGPIKEVIPYLIRRAEENTSVKGQTSRELELIKKELKRRDSI